jgi:7,8-dihydropterin-6-yl-methyl-4-(beta-D-ribofuranosyl)aminobenzene 5'-phosphate synthase
VINDLSITVLSDDSVSGRNLLAEHGLCFWIEADGRHILFDTGQGMVVSHNAEVLAIPLEHTDAVALSHGHYDHTGGLAEVLSLAPQAEVFGHPDMLQSRYACKPSGEPVAAGAPAALSTHASSWQSRFHATAEPTEICPGVWVTGQIPRVTPFEDTGGRFYRDAAATVPDLILDDQAVVIETTCGLVVVLGCAHAGVINTLQLIRQRVGEMPVRGIMGGMHLLHADDERIRQTIAFFHDLDAQVIAPCHCTGAFATARIMQALPQSFRRLEVGARLNFT